MPLWSYMIKRESAVTFWALGKILIDGRDVTISKILMARRYLGYDVMIYIGISRKKKHEKAKWRFEKYHIFSFLSSSHGVPKCFHMSDLGMMSAHGPMVTVVPTTTTTFRTAIPRNWRYCYIPNGRRENFTCYLFNIHVLTWIASNLNWPAATQVLQSIMAEKFNSGLR